MIRVSVCIRECVCERVWGVGERVCAGLYGCVSVCEGECKLSEHACVSVCVNELTAH